MNMPITIRLKFMRKKKDMGSIALLFHNINNEPTKKSLTTLTFRSAEGKGAESFFTATGLLISYSAKPSYISSSSNYSDL